MLSLFPPVAAKGQNVPKCFCLNLKLNDSKHLTLEKPSIALGFLAGNWKGKIYGPFCVCI